MNVEKLINVVLGVVFLVIILGIVANAWEYSSGNFEKNMSEHPWHSTNFMSREERTGMDN
jgi:hypothetical protein